MVEETNVMWDNISTCIKKGGREIRGESKGNWLPNKETWWLNELVQKVIKAKRESLGESKCRN